MVDRADALRKGEPALDVSRRVAVMKWVRVWSCPHTQDPMQTMGLSASRRLSFHLIEVIPRLESCYTDRSHRTADQNVGHRRNSLYKTGQMQDALRR